MSAAKTKAQGIIDDNAVGMLESFYLQLPLLTSTALAVFSKSYCPYCKATKSLLTEMGAKYYALELDQVGTSTTKPYPKYTLADHLKTPDDGSAIQGALAEITGQSTVPNVFIGKEHIGGNSDVQAKKKQLPALLKDAGAL